MNPTTPLPLQGPCECLLAPPMLTTCINFTPTGDILTRHRYKARRHATLLGTTTWALQLSLCAHAAPHVPAMAVASPTQSHTQCAHLHSKSCTRAPPHNLILRWTTSCFVCTQHDHSSLHCHDGACPSASCLPAFQQISLRIYTWLVAQKGFHRP